MNYVKQFTVKGIDDPIIIRSENRYEHLEGHRAVFIGDSYSTGGSLDYSDRTTRRFPALISAALRMTECNYAVGSTGFVDPGSSGQNAPFHTQVQTAYDDLGANAGDVRLVVIAGGLNDWNESYGSADISQGVSSAVQLASNLFTNAEILVIPMLFPSSGLNIRAVHFAGAAYRACAGIPRTAYIEGAYTWLIGLNYMINHSTVDHPNVSGHKRIADMILTHLSGGAAYASQLISPTLNSGYSSTVNDNGYLMYQNGTVNWSGAWINGRLTAGEATVIGTVPPMAVPISNVFIPLIKGNYVHGSVCITSAGNMVARSDIDITDGFFVSPVSYMPSGKWE